VHPPQTQTLNHRVITGRLLTLTAQS